VLPDRVAVAAPSFLRASFLGGQSFLLRDHGYNGNAMSRQLEAIYERGVLRLIEPLALAENQRVRLTLVEKPLSWPSTDSVNERREEMYWLAKESRPYAGQWVALDGPRLVAHGAKLATVTAAAKAAGVERPLFASVPDDDLPSGGW